MSSLEVGTGIFLGPISPAARRKAALRIAGQIAAENPHLTAEQIATDPQLMQGLCELLDAVFGTRHSRRNP